LATLADVIGQRAQTVATMVGQHTDALGAAVQASEQKTQDVSSGMKHLVEELSAAAGRVTERIAEAGRGFAAESTSMNDAVRTALGLIDEVSARFRQQTEELTQRSQQAGGQIDATGAVVRQHAEHLSHAVMQAAEGLHGIGDAFAGESTQLTGTADQVSARITALTEQFRAQSGDLDKAIEMSARQIEAAGQNLGRQRETLDAATSRSIDQVAEIGQNIQHHSGSLLRTLEEVMTRADRTGTAFDDTADRMIHAADRAEERAKQFQVKEQGLRRDLFLKTARFVIEDLNSTAIDLSRALFDEVPEADWKRYAGGDRSVFTRTLLRGRNTVASTGRVAEKVRHNEEMRRYVTQYIDQFERLLAEARECDPEQLLHSTFLTADVGKLYLMLCGAMGRGEEDIA
jgi:ABC-type transporter Mla subunit MlaD